MKKKKIPVLLKIAMTALLFSAIGLVQAEGKSLKTTMDSYLVSVDKKNKETIKPTKEAEPGQIIEYRIEATNVGETPLSGLVINGPIPANTGYLAHSNKTTSKHTFLVSIDGGSRWDEEPVKRQRKDKDGKLKEVIIGAEEYTHTRWVLKNNLAPKKKLTFSYRITVD